MSHVNPDISPGPWTCELNARKTAYVVRDANDRFVCDMSWHSTNPTHFPLQPQSKANARLIGAAPDLLEALKLAARELGMYVDLQQKLDYIEYAARSQKDLDVVNAALAKAGYVTESQS